jgi:hypothetical protein
VSFKIEYRYENRINRISSRDGKIVSHISHRKYQLPSQGEKEMNEASQGEGAI